MGDEVDDNLTSLCLTEEEKLYDMAKEKFEAKEHYIQMGQIQPAETGEGWVHGQFYYFVVLPSRTLRVWHAPRWDDSW